MKRTIINKLSLMLLFIGINSAHANIQNERLSTNAPNIETVYAGPTDSNTNVGGNGGESPNGSGKKGY